MNGLLDDPLNPICWATRRMPKQGVPSSLLGYFHQPDQVVKENQSLLKRETLVFVPPHLSALAS